MSESPTANGPKLALIGTGEMGRMALGMLIRRLPGASFQIFDQSPENVARAASLAPERVVAEVRDVLKNPPALDGVDLVISFAGPFYRGSDAIAGAALAAGCTYLDICDDVEGAQAVLALADDARKARVGLITGAGNSPGMSNVIAKKLIEQNPDANGIRVVWVVRDADPGGLAPLRHMLHMAVEPCPIWENGRLVETPGFVPSTRRDYELPEPVGAVAAFDTAHPEPVTMGRAFPELNHVSVQGALLPAWANDAFSTLGRIGFGYADLTVAVNGVDVRPDEVLWKVLWARHEARSGGRSKHGLTCVQVQALKGEEVTATMTILDDHSMARTTGLGACAAVLAALETPVPPGAWGTEVLNSDRTLELFAELAEAEGALPHGLLTDDRSLASA